ncbi:SCO6880 family protein [Rarobacter incanus]|uniref:Uncharacterized protein n=1 Tax=Rarobacter incanus TaxID=153494 RepID=A0A542SMM2_9MICO|nr:hypothetical protein FB389_0515 [Rarobacter incanus]
MDFATNPRGTTYAYFICSVRAAKKTTCTRRAVPVQVAERLVQDSYRDITISEADYRHLAAEVDAAFDEQSAGRDQELTDLTANRAMLEGESDKLLAAHFADAIDLPTLKRHQDPIRAGLVDIKHRLTQHDEHHSGARAFLHDSLRLLTDAHRLRPPRYAVGQRMAQVAGVSGVLVAGAAVHRHSAAVFADLHPDRSDQAARDIRKKKVEHISDQAQRAKIGQIEDASQTAEYHDVLQQEADLTAGHGILRYTGLIAVSAPTVEELDAAVAAIEQAAIQAPWVCQISGGSGLAHFS